jgi:hypothetical protein
VSRAQLGFDVLLKGPAQSNVDHLHPTANAQDRHVALEGSMCERKLKAVAAGVYVFAARLTFGPIGGWVYVEATRQQQTIELFKDPDIRLRDGGDQHNISSCVLYGGHVRVANQHSWLSVPYRPAGYFAGGADSDQWHARHLGRQLPPPG